VVVVLAIQNTSASMVLEALHQSREASVYEVEDVVSGHPQLPPQPICDGSGSRRLSGVAEPL
jgi:hypothetical protein